MSNNKLAMPAKKMLKPYRTFEVISTKVFDEPRILWSTRMGEFGQEKFYRPWKI